MRHYKTLKGQARQTTQLNADIIINNLMRHKSQGWITCVNDQKEKAIDQIVEELGGDMTTREDTKQKLMCGNVNHWSLSRFIYNEKRDKFGYCAGQDYSAEIREIRNDLKK